MHPGESGAITLPTTKHHTYVVSANAAVHEHTQESPPNSPKRLKLQQEIGLGKTLLVEGKRTKYFVKFNKELSSSTIK